MPASWLAGLTGQLPDHFADAASRERLFPEDVRRSRRRVGSCAAAQVVARQPDREENVLGPAEGRRRMRPARGRAPPQGFASKNGVAVTALQQGAKDPAQPGREHLLFVKKSRVARRARCCRPPRRDSSGPAFPKRMSWDAWLDDGKGAFPFGRPIRWLVALLDGTVMPFVIYELVDGAKGQARGGEGGRSTSAIASCRAAAGGRPRSFAARGARRKRCDARFVILAPEERARTIAEELARATAAPASDDHGLARGMAGPRRVPDRGGRRGPRASSAPCRAKSWRPCSSTTRSTSRLLDAGRSSASPPSPTATEKRRAASFAAWSAWWWRACATRPSSRGGPQAAARGPRGRPRRV